MSFFGSGAQSAHQNQKHEKSAEQKESESQAAIFFMVMAVLFKYLPAVLPGLLSGVVANKAARGKVKLEGTVANSRW